MLVLTRKINQSIVIGDDIEVSVLSVSRDKIRLGITAPREVPVYRKEIQVEIENGGAPSENGSGAEPEAIEIAADRLTSRNGSTPG